MVKSLQLKYFFHPFASIKFETDLYVFNQHFIIGIKIIFLKTETYDEWIIEDSGDIRCFVRLQQLIAETAWKQNLKTLHVSTV